MNKPRSLCILTVILGLITWASFFYVSIDALGHISRSNDSETNMYLGIAGVAFAIAAGLAMGHACRGLFDLFEREE